MRLVRLREKLGMTQRDLAAELRVSAGAVAHWELGTHRVPGPVSLLLDACEAELGLRDSPAPAEAPDVEGILRASPFARTVYSALSPLVAQGAATPLIARVRQRVLERGAIALARMKFPERFAQLTWSLLRAAGLPLPPLAATAAPALHALDAAEVVHAELGQQPRKVFAEWEPTPFALGSIGQVHRARLQSGEPVAVKVQYPTAPRDIADDFELARVLEHTARLLLERWDPSDIIGELSARIREECDYRREAQHQRELADAFQNHPVLAIPRVHTRYSTGRVLCTDLATGATLDAFARTASEDDRARAADALIDFYWGGLLVHAVFNADVHAGNLLFEAGRVTCLDFGRAKRVSPDTRAQLQRVCRAAFERDSEAAIAALTELGITRETTPLDDGHLMRVLMTLCEPSLRDGRYRYTPEYFHRLWLRFSHNVNKDRVSYPARLVLIEQVFLGLPALVGRLGARVACRERIMELLYPPPTPRPSELSAAELRLLGIPDDGWA